MVKGETITSSEIVELIHRIIWPPCLLNLLLIEGCFCIYSTISRQWERRGKEEIISICPVFLSIYLSSVYEPYNQDMFICFFYSFFHLDLEITLGLFLILWFYIVQILY